jgi:hypothetical protein
MAFVKCISTRSTHEDTIYKTGVWSLGDVKNVPDETAKKLLRHPDVYAAATAEEAPNAQPVIIEPVKEDKMQAVYDDLAKMSKESLKTFIKANFNRNVDMRQPEAKLRAYATQLADQFGVA